jgi:electron transport complex protein RnfB
MLPILYAFASVAGLGLIFGVGLAFASRLLYVRKDERLEAIEAALPGANCGACSFPGCAAYAAAIVGGEVALDACTVGGVETAKKIAGVMGVEYAGSAGQKMVTQVHCRGGRNNAQYGFEYEGVEDCNALYALYGGNKLCKFGCLGLGSCIRVCPVDAIHYDDQGLVWVNKEICISCGQCLKVCPTGVMRWVPYEADLIVACNSTDKGGAVRKYCKVGCIACKLCEKKSPEGGYHVEDNLSRIDYQVSGERKEGAAACPTKCIIENDVHDRRP